MNDLQKLIKLKGLSILDVSREINQGYHITQKVIKGVTYKRKDGSLVARSSRGVQNGVADLLGLSRDQVWGPKSSSYLRRHIKAEIKRQARLKERDMEKEWLQGDKITDKRTNGNV
jgi:hypothetical protein